MSRQEGFTILEVTLYLSISALLAGSLLFGLAAMVRDQEWHDALKSTLNLVQTQYQAVANNVNSSTTSTCSGTTANAGATNCLLIGRYIYFSGQSYTTGSIVTDGSAFNGTNSDSTALASATFQDVNVSRATSLSWGSTFANIYSLDDASKSYNTLAIVRSPISSAIYVVPWNSTTSTQPVFDSSLFSATNTNHSLSIAIYNGSASGNSGGALCLAAGSSASNAVLAAPVAPNSVSSVTAACNNILVGD